MPTHRTERLATGASRLRALWLALLVVLSAPAHADRPEVVTIALGISNVHLIKAPRPVLVDAGSKTDLPALQAALATQGVALGDLAAVILTHAHADHAGLAAALRKRSAAVLVLGRGDLPMAAAGQNAPTTPTGWFARLMLLLPLDPDFPPFVPDLVVDAPLDLARFGIAGQLLPVPGHTPGSLALVLDDGRAFIGDMVLGGWLGGALFARCAGEHYVHDDIQRNRAGLVELLRRPLHSFYLGHGGPVSRDSVLRGFGLTDPRQP